MAKCAGERKVLQELYEDHKVCQSGEVRSVIGKVGILFCVSLVAVFSYNGATNPDSRAQLAVPSPSQEPPPTPKPTPAEEVTRYVAWMKKQGKAFADKPHENVSLRIGDWGFFYHGDRPAGSFTPLQSRAALDRSGHVVTEDENGDWHALLASDGLDAAGALKRVAWLFNAGGLDPTNVLPREASPGKITAPVLTAKDGVITFQGWWQAFTDPPYRRRITIMTTPTHTSIVIEPGAGNRNAHKSVIESP